MPDGRRRSREGWADAMEDGPPVAAAHTHRLPPLVRVAIGGLVVAVFCLLVAVSLLSVYVYQANQYVQGRGQFRDQENARTNQRINDAICDLLDQLPEGGLLDRPRATYGCGPGIPLDQLTPEEQAQIAGRLPPVAAQPSTPPSAPSGPAPVLGDPASPDAPPVPAPVLPPREPTTSPTPDPLVDLGPITDIIEEILK